MRLNSKDILNSIIQKYVRDTINTVIPGKVVAVSRFQDQQTVDVTVQVSRLYSNGEVLQYEDQVLYNIPVVFPSAGGGLLSFPVAVGDTLALMSCTRNIESWLLSEGDREVIPQDSRHYSEDDVIAIPGLYTIRSNLSPSPTDVELKFKNSSFRIEPDDSITIENALGTLNISPFGTFSFVGPGGSITLEDSGSYTLTNGSGTVSMASGGTVDINGVTFSPGGVVTIPASLLLAGKEIAGHDHNINSGSSAPGPTGGNN